ncbi:MAG: twin-arginine translocase TatA/TatE family subunit [Deltaproteobacteria bacterium]|nr:twin-arginine translocase TatA/TatE family subunit [Deltaproteobacteria bacterium]
MFAFGMPGTTEWIVILVIVLIFFGAGKLPDVFRQAGKGIKAFKDASEGKDDDGGEAPATQKEPKPQIAAKDDLDDEPEGEKQASSSKRKAEGQ